MADLLVADARIIDGSGALAFAGSLTVSGDRIERVLRDGEPQPEAAQRIDAAGGVLAPGFIDVHNHSDISPFVEPGMDSMMRQGVTTVVVGNCGSSAVPPAGAVEMAELAGVRPEDLDVGWRTFGEYLSHVDAARPAINVAALVGHGSVRLSVMGEERRPPTPPEMAAMRSVVDEAMQAGAVGMSSGLIYAPGIHATTDELVALASVAEPHGGLYASHIRGEGAPVFDAVAECIEIGRRAGVPSHVSHLKVETDLVWGRAGELLSLIDEARARGDDVSADQYPYTAWESELASCLPPWASPAELPSLLADPVTRERLRRAVDSHEDGWHGCGEGIGWDRIVVVAHAGSPEYTGKSIADIATLRGADTLETIFDLLTADRFTSIIGHAMLEEDVRTILAREDVMVASDGLAVSPGGPLGRFNVHPRYYGTFPRVLGRYVRDEPCLSLEAAVRKMTSLPAERFRLSGRGVIAEGAFADLVVFDPARVADRATFDAPHAFPDGIDVVIVNGRVAWDGRSGERAGRAVRRG